MAIVTNPDGLDGWSINNDIYGKNWMRYGFAIQGHPDSLERNLWGSAQRNEEVVTGKDREIGNDAN